MAETMNVKGASKKRPPRQSEAAPSAKPRARQAAPGAGSGGGGTPSGAAPPEPRMTPDDKKLHASLTRFYAMVGMGVTSAGMARQDLGLATAGVNITSMAEETANSYLELAQQSPRMRKALQGFVQGSAAAALIGSHIAMAAPVLAARGVVDPNIGAMFLSDDAKAFFTANATPPSATNGSQPAGAA